MTTKMLLAFILICAGTGMAAANPDRWLAEWPRTDFSKHAVDFSEIFSGGPPKDGIPAIDQPRFAEIADIDDIGPQEPVIGLIINGDARAYPLRVLIWHEIANDTVGGVPVAVTYCPLCNAAIVFDRSVDGQVLDFGTTGKLRNSDLIMYDRQTESWWQQFLGRGIVGSHTDTQLRMLPARLESFANFKQRAPKGKVLIPNHETARPYGATPYAGYDSSGMPFLYRGETPEGILPLARVVRVENRAWSLQWLQQQGRIETEDGLILTWQPGQNSAMDQRSIADSADVGNVVVQKLVEGKLTDIVYGVDYAFAFHAFFPDQKIQIGE